jgi:hypothetical protein
MRLYSNKISLTKNARGVYSLDPSIGCNSGIKNNPKGCYSDCYAYKSAKIYGYDFSKTIYRDFENESHKNKIINQINNIKLDFVRMGTSGDPSENWEHTINILNKIKNCNKQIVIITKHWTNLSLEQLDFLGKINVCINTSVSALDNPFLLENALIQYDCLKKYCKSVLRVVSCDFNLENEKGKSYSEIQHKLFKNTDVIDTVFRVSKNNPLVTENIINYKKSKFLGKNNYISKLNKKTYFGHCNFCKESCGVKIKLENRIYPQKPGIIKQISFLD